MVWTLSLEGLTELIAALTNCDEETARYAAEPIMRLVEDRLDTASAEAFDRGWNSAGAAIGD